ncbi:MAG: hypothetical protein MJE68_02300 [Proteobacteria bacterium]|nr:hypothetical protein [Pseudomonadota bacterium]
MVIQHCSKCRKLPSAAGLRSLSQQPMAVTHVDNVEIFNWHWCSECNKDVDILPDENASRAFQVMKSYYDTSYITDTSYMTS